MTATQQPPKLTTLDIENKLAIIFSDDLIAFFDDYKKQTELQGKDNKPYYVIQDWKHEKAITAIKDIIAEARLKELEFASSWGGYDTNHAYHNKPFHIIDTKELQDRIKQIKEGEE